ncbi:tRNA (guanosine(46)-N7)-methyltransferase TrmB [Beggiatoa leptomitoformis]|uniref:tRNA (guanine-N(7)-)-methyltransferase n=1 Tax=Beggiatoa leptomitoformis TaxID=288004 RepID=A0A2N9YH20_9GAMM|nr:tRNA (guanosine(46)-N7)-methyltransferase TrmB [Beggiatoa leptomitoformis]ALG68015.1 tRNA (guanosine(46)-N7)-methyltransferase TrmB [Beggiatoa leptomitoformis]AUI69699.1 tRNA (guanosine(46)-N7)-methyltransferase TrmB [Beggiatoa leptomitoformis]
MQPLTNIRSFVRRNGRMTPSQQLAYTNLWSRYGVDPVGVLDLNDLFARSQPKHLEIGFGMGDALLEMAQQHPENDYLGIDVHLPGFGKVLKQIEAENITNIRLFNGDAVLLLQNHIALASLDTVYLFFPDPWHKKRHNKRRLVQAAFVELLASRLTTEGIFHLATDWQDYAEQMLQVMEASPQFQNMTAPNSYAPRPADRPLTKFEQRGHRHGHGVWDLLYKKTTPSIF